MNVKCVIYITLIFGFVSAVQGARKCKSPTDCHQKCDEGFQHVCKAPEAFRSDGCFCEKNGPNICKTNSDCKKLLPTCDTKTHDLLCFGPTCSCQKHQCSSNTDCSDRICYMDASFYPRYPVCNAKHSCECLRKEKDTLKECKTTVTCTDILDCPKRTAGKRCVDNKCYCIKSCGKDDPCIGDASCVDGYCVANTLTFG